jgi:translation initiation factor 2B subunit (eIF-2B alpha/beta/delta family)
MNITEQRYLELAEDAKNRYEELEHKLNSKKNELINIKKELISCYGYVRILDNIYNSQAEIEPNCALMIEVLRDFLSQFTEDHINFNVE